MNRILVVILLVMCVPAFAQQSPQTSVPVTISPELYNAIQRYLRVTPGGNPIDVMQMLVEAQIRAEKTKGTADCSGPASSASPECGGPQNRN